MSTLHVELLTKARERISDGTNYGICGAVADIGCELGYYSQSEEVREHISKILGDYAFLDSWLFARGYPVLEAGNSQKLRETRLAWIDWLIEEWRDAP